jgi:hypothetical protein
LEYVFSANERKYSLNALAIACGLSVDFPSIFNIHSLAVQLVVHTASNKKVQKHKIRRMRGPHNWSSSSYPLTREIHIQTVMDNVNRCIVQLKNKTVTITNSLDTTNNFYIKQEVL